MTIEPMQKEDISRSAAVKLLLAALIVMGISGALWAKHENGRPDSDNPEADCYRFPGVWSGECKADYAGQRLVGAGTTHSAEYLERNK